MFKCKLCDRLADYDSGSGVCMICAYEYDFSEEKAQNI